MMKNNRSGFSLVEVVVAMVIVVIMTGITITVISLSGKQTSKAEHSIRASSEARSVTDIYVASKKDGYGLPTDDFIKKLGLYYDVADMSGKYSISDTEDNTGKIYILFYNSGFGLGDAPANVRLGGYAFSLELTVYTAASGSKMTVKVIQYATNPSGEKTLYEY
jgi:prepilin-type N-terminal cleavage/methylation domain-containing protein